MSIPFGLTLLAATIHLTMVIAWYIPASWTNGSTQEVQTVIEAAQIASHASLRSNAVIAHSSIPLILHQIMQILLHHL